MNKKIVAEIALVFLLGCGALIAPLPAFAQNISVDPIEWDFGDVEIGSTVFKEFKITALDPTPLTITDIQILDTSPSPFSISTVIPSTIILIPSEMFVAEIAFSPTEMALSAAHLQILSDASGFDDDLRLPLHGTGVIVTAAPEPATLALMGLGLAGIGYTRRKKLFSS